MFNSDFIDSFKEVIVKAENTSEKQLKIRIEIEKLKVECEEAIDLNVLKGSDL